MLYITLVYAIIHLLQASYLYRESYRGDVIYHLLTDRFYDGDSKNNDPPESPGLYDGSQNNWKLYWGGDFEGIRQKLTYLKDLGVTAIWISPPYDNINKKVMYNHVPNSGYHGYWARDFKTPEEHFGTWADFDALIQCAHSLNLKIIIDWAPNHTGPADPLDPSFSERGILLNGGQYVADYLNQSCHCFHKNGGIVDWDRAYESKYLNIADLPDLDHTNEQVHRTLREALDTWIERDIDGIRLDAIKHMTRGWLTSLADQVNSKVAPRFIFGEWYMNDFSNPLFHEAIRFSNQSGICHMDFLLNHALREAFAWNGSFQKLDSVIVSLVAHYEHSGHNVVTFIDNHDMPRFLTLNPDRKAFDQALVFLFTQRGTPCVYYGSEQYLHNDMHGGSDPWNRLMMPRDGFNTRSAGFRLIQQLSELKRNSSALKWGNYIARYVTDHVLIYERKLTCSAVLVAINKLLVPTTLPPISISFPPGLYQNQLDDGNLHALINVQSNGRISNNVVLGGQTSAVWLYEEYERYSQPMLCSVAPMQVRTGNIVALDGRNFGQHPGEVLLENRTAEILSWTNKRIIVLIPSNIQPGIRYITVKTNRLSTNAHSLRILSGRIYI